MSRILPRLVCLAHTTRFHVYIGHQWSRHGWQLPQSKWANPFRIRHEHDPHESLQQYETYVRQSDLWDELAELDGTVMACWCKTEGEKQKSCHGDVLVRLFQERFPEAIAAPEVEAPDQGQTVYRPLKGTKNAGPPQKKFRTQATNPTGIHGQAWPELDQAEIPFTCWVDEAGMGPWAGPLHVAGVALKPDFCMQGIHDSKLLKPHERERLYDALVQSPDDVIFHVEAIPAARIDELGLGRAWREGVKTCIARVVAKAEQQCIQLRQAVLDGNKGIDDAVLPVDSRISGDRRFVGVACASILAKVSRDRYMKAQAPNYPEFFDIFDQAMGYAGGGKRKGPSHAELIQAGKFTDEHRKSFNPLRSKLKKRVKVVPKGGEDLVSLNSGASAISFPANHPRT